MSTGSKAIVPLIIALAVVSLVVLILAFLVLPRLFGGGEEPSPADSPSTLDPNNGASDGPSEAERRGWKRSRNRSGSWRQKRRNWPPPSAKP